MGGSVLEKLGPHLRITNANDISKTEKSSSRAMPDPSHQSAINDQDGTLHLDTP